MALNRHTFLRWGARTMRWARGPAEFALTSTLALIPNDMLSDAARQIMRWSMPLVNTPEDALPHLLYHFGLPQYVESYAATLARLVDAWPTHEVAGAEDMLAAEAERCGITNATITRDNVTDSTFWIEGDNINPVIPSYDDAGVIYTGGAVTYGCQAPSNDVAKNIRAMIRKFRPARERYRGLRRIVPPDYHADLCVWLDAAMGVTLAGPNVTDWEDRHTSANYSAVGTPTMSTLGSDVAIDLDGATEAFIADAVFGFSNLRTLFLVIDPDAAPFGEERLWTDDNLNGTVYHSEGVGEVNAYDDGTAIRESDAATSVPQCLTLRLHSGLGEGQFRTNGVPHAAGALPFDGTFTDAGDTVTIGANAAAVASFFDGRIAEIIAYNRTLAMGEVRAVERYIGRRYGIFDWDDVI